jgi:hypothetical protein
MLDTINSLVNLILFIFISIILCIIGILLILIKKRLHKLENKFSDSHKTDMMIK